MPMETRHDIEHTTERLTKGLRCPWKWGHYQVISPFCELIILQNRGFHDCFQDVLFFCCLIWHLQLAYLHIFHLVDSKSGYLRNLFLIGKVLGWDWENPNPTWENP